MNYTNLGDSGMSNKKAWTAPAINVIPLSSARVTTHNTAANDGSSNKS
jgi:hypothetical protein